MSLHAAIELGGTKVVVGFGRDGALAEPVVRIPTTDPETTFRAVLEVLEARQRDMGLDAIGVCSFGPVGVDPARSDYGFILETPKPGWSRFDLLDPLRRLGRPLGLATDVGGAALGEGRWGAAQGLADHAYVTVGTGVGVGIISGGKLVAGALHPEAGHLPVSRDPGLDPYAGHCPFHGDCLEGLVCGPALRDRIGQAADRLADDHPVWALVADYLAQLAASLSYTVSPERIVLGGGVGGRQALHRAIRTQLSKRLNGYLPHLRTPEAIEAYLVLPGLGDLSAIMGGLVLAEQAMIHTDLPPQRLTR